MNALYTFILCQLWKNNCNAPNKIHCLPLYLPLRDNLILHALESFLWYLMTSRLVCNSTSVLINGEDKIKERATSGG